MKNLVLGLGATVALLLPSFAFAWEGMNHTFLYPQMGDGHRYAVPLPELYRLYDHLEWEVIAGFRHKDGHMGTYKPGDLIGATLSVAPIGGRTYARAKSFRGNMPKPVIELLKDGDPKGEVVEKVRFQSGSC